MPRADINLISLVAAVGAVAFIEAGRTAEILLELVKLNVIIPGWGSGECGLNVGNLIIDEEGRTF